MLNRKKQICELLKGIETGDASSVAVVNQDKYIQHNPQTREGGEGLAVLFKRLSKSKPRVNIVRIFEDGDYIFAHTEYDFSDSNIGFEIFRFEGNQTIEHWDNIQLRHGRNAAGYTMVDGETEVTDHDKTEINRGIIQSFISEVLINRQLNEISDYLIDDYIEHSHQSGNGLPALRSAQSEADSIQYIKNHRVLAEGNFVLSVCEGTMNGLHSSFYDLYRLRNNKIVEHWDTTEEIPARSEWKNDNGKF